MSRAVSHNAACTGRRSMDSDYEYGPKDSDSDFSDRSYHSHSTAPTDYSARPPPLDHDECSEKLRQLKLQGARHYEHAYPPPTYPQQEYSEGRDSSASVGTYASTVESVADLEDDMPEYEVPQYKREYFHPNVIPATPSDFTELFPSSRRLEISHDDTTSDGNMNLRVDTIVRSSRGKELKLTLFHLRMHDLKNREFSLRRYCRDSGREVCHSVRKYQKPAAERRPGFSRSVSNALASFRSKSDSKTPTQASLKRSDSGYASLQSEEIADVEGRPQSAGGLSACRTPIPTNTTKLEFSNYAQLEVKRRGTKSGKRYEFEHWGSNYVWRRIVKTDGEGKEISYHLYHDGNDRSLAHIRPEIMDAEHEREERSKGGWVPPCYMRITDETLLRSNTDISE